MCRRRLEADRVRALGDIVSQPLTVKPAYKLQLALTT